MALQRFCPLLVATCLCSIALGAPYQVQGGKVTSGDVRFTVLSPTLVRLEHAPGGAFIDDPSVLVLDRDWPACKFTTAEEDEWLVLSTSSMELRWLIGSVPFSAENLMISWKSGGMGGTWRPGKKDAGNLRGTRGALDGIRSGSLPPLDEGLLSREGWTLLDDSHRPLWLGEDGWLKERPGGASDRYFFAYGQDYGHMLSQFVKLCGRIPMMPRYVWGAWYSRYWAFTDQEERNIVNRFRELDIPLDVLVIDVDWHKYGWEGYDWNEDLFPDPEGFLKWVHDQGVYVTLNNHPGSPLPLEDTHHPAAAKMAGLSGEDLNKPLPWDLADKKKNRAFVEAAHWPLESIGVDFWWIDGNPPANMSGLNSTTWCAKTYYDGTQRRTGQRSLVFSRYGDLGQHRYPAGFSGDVYSDWDVLNYEIRYTTRAGNVAFPYWSHDIGGFHGNRIDPELYVRWCQFGALSPVLRLHSNHGVREPWEYGEQAQEIVRKYFKLRHRLYPYLNTCQREVYDTGMPLCRALYMHWPQHEESYTYDYEYMLGPDLLVAPITTATDGAAAAKEIWIPPGLWWDYWTGEPYHGPSVIVYRAELDRCPMFAKAGAIIPMQPEMSHMGEKPASPITVDLWTGADGQLGMYEDDGISLEYQKAAHSVTPISCSQVGRDVRVKIGPTSGSFEGMLTSRAWEVRVNASSRPQSVTMKRTSSAISTLAAAPTGPGAEDVLWSYDENARQTVVQVPLTGSGSEIQLTLAGAISRAPVQALAELSAVSSCAQDALSAGRQLGLDAATLAKIAALREAAEKGFSDIDQGQATEAVARRSISAGLGAAWSAVSASKLAGPDRDALLKRLIGLSVFTHMRSLEGTAGRQVTVSVASRVPVAGAVLKSEPVVAEGWSIAGDVRAHVAEFATTGSAMISYMVTPPGKIDEPPLGHISFGVDLTVGCAGSALTIPARTHIDCSFVQQWHLIGPFANKDGKGLETVYPPEQGIDLTKRYPGFEGEAKWQTTQWALPPGDEDAASFINLEPRFKPKDNAIAYAASYIISSKEQPAVLSVGTDDGCKVWLNGQQVLYHPEPRPPEPGQDRIEVTLKQGVNTVMYKVANEGGQWGLFLQVLGRDGRPLPGLHTTLTPGR